MQAADAAAMTHEPQAAESR